MGEQDDTIVLLRLRPTDDRSLSRPQNSALAGLPCMLRAARGQRNGGRSGTQRVPRSLYRPRASAPSPTLCAPLPVLRPKTFSGCGSGTVHHGPRRHAIQRASRPGGPQPEQIRRSCCLLPWRTLAAPHRCLGSHLMAWALREEPAPRGPPTDAGGAVSELAAFSAYISGWLHCINSVA